MNLRCFPTLIIPHAPSICFLAFPPPSPAHILFFLPHSYYQYSQSSPKSYWFSLAGSPSQICVFLLLAISAILVFWFYAPVTQSSCNHWSWFAWAHQSIFDDFLTLRSSASRSFLENWLLSGLKRKKEIAIGEASKAEC